MNSKIIVALDYDSKNEALNFLDKIDASLCKVKIGKELFTSLGVDFIREVHRRNYDLFLDLKYHDIPNTVKKAVKAAADLGVWMVDIHASGGFKMMEESKKILESYGEDAPLLIAVTVLTSMEQSDLQAIGINKTPLEQVITLAKLAQQAGMDGVVCSSQEVSTLKNILGSDFKLVTPGIRPLGSDLGDQKRVMTPSQAITAGSDYLVIGRPITQAKDPVAILTSINEELAKL